MPWSRRTRNDAAHSALATPLPRHGRRTETCSSHARLIPSASFSSRKIAFITTPATWSPSQATHQIAGVMSGTVEACLEVRLLGRAMAPVVLERLVVGVEDRAVLVLGDGPHLEALRQRMIRQGPRQVAAHLEAVADGHVPVLGEERPVGRLGLEGIGTELAGPGSRVVRALGGQPRPRREIQRAADAPPPDLGGDIPLRLGHERPVTDQAVAHRIAGEADRRSRPGACRARA